MLCLVEFLTLKKHKRILAPKVRGQHTFGIPTRMWKQVLEAYDFCSSRIKIVYGMYI